jgi:hypothetical protein
MIQAILTLFDEHEPDRSPALNEQRPVQQATQGNDR